MKKLYPIILLLILLVSCSEDDPEIEDSLNPVSEILIEGMGKWATYSYSNSELSSALDEVRFSFTPETLVIDSSLNNGIIQSTSTFNYQLNSNNEIIIDGNNVLFRIIEINEEKLVTDASMQIFKSPLSIEPIEIANLNTETALEFQFDCNGNENNLEEYLMGRTMLNLFVEGDDNNPFFGAISYTFQSNGQLIIQRTEFSSNQFCESDTLESNSREVPYAFDGNSIIPDNDPLDATIISCINRSLMIVEDDEDEVWYDVDQLNAFNISLCDERIIVEID